MLQFYRVKSDFFEIEKSYSFNVFLYDVLRNQRLLNLSPNNSISEEIMDQWKHLEDKGAYFQIYKEDLGDFIEQTSITEDDILELNKFYFKMYELQASRIMQYEEIVNKEFFIRKTVKNISETDNYRELIDRVKAEVLCFPLYHSSTVSICTELVEKLFLRDILPVRVASLAYYVAKLNKIVDMDKLAQIIIGSLVKDLGLDLINRDLLENFLKLTQTEIYQKHPALTIYLLTKSGFEMDKGIKRIILEHHEQVDGSGFPRQKKEGHIDYVSYIVNLSDQIMLYSSGTLNGTHVPLNKTIEMFSKGIEANGTNIQFPPRLLESLQLFLMNESDEKENG